MELKQFAGTGITVIYQPSTAPNGIETFKATNKGLKTLYLQPHRMELKRGGRESEVGDDLPSTAPNGIETIILTLLISGIAAFNRTEWN